MAQKSNIQWTDATWNIARGCTKVSKGCKFCYMFRDGHRYGFNAMQVTRTKTVFRLPLTLRTPSKIFTSSLTDFFHKQIDGYRHEAWDIISQCPHHTFQVLTKRPERIINHLPEGWKGGWDNVWLGTSIEDQEAMHRLETLATVPAKTRFISFGPLLGPIDFRGYKVALRKIDWAIIGGESGNDNGKFLYRPCELEWIKKLSVDLKEAGVSVFVKQLGTFQAKIREMSDRHGGNMSEFPKELRVRNFPLN